MIFHYFHQQLQYLDSAVTCLVPKVVAECSYQYLTQEHANSHRGIYQLSQNVTAKVEQSRSLISDFIKANSPKEIIFCSGTTDAINIIAKHSENYQSLVLTPAFDDIDTPKQLAEFKKLTQ
ncbi:aminotransferase class V-fold PLP-dependent enzyme [Pseudocolwellia sp. AS88]|uniref:aminotransferase class V-fold PLP-dependent enzyme n=1 Tax=Pseudocolwellia sp. AS88 TaxID=3063958 RepID=UPI0026EA3F87|nr:aminotransferase class V-fold PLP-dependent enzyme [Pseudocolwellia sp. AS88]MDO7085174.1 aminotransferase class V-fold PLP-dependent enzyme [Pseudocolwellia sp. AS88]